MSAIDRAEALERVDGDEELLQDLIDIFSDDSQRLMEDIRQAVAAGSADCLCAAAHSLKGSSASICATAVSQAALTLENMGRDGAMAGVEEALEALETDMAEFEREAHAAPVV